MSTPAHAPLLLLSLASLTGLGAATHAQATPGSVDEVLEIAAGSNGFGGLVESGDGFGSSLAALGDLDGDGVVDLAFGAPGDDDGGPGYGAVWILFMQADGSVGHWQKISATSGGFGGELDNNLAFGSSVSAVGDVDADGHVDLIVGAPRDSASAALLPEDDPHKGGAWILFLRADGTVKAEQRLSEGVGGFGADLANNDRFGTAVVGLGDVDGDGTPDVAISAPRDDDAKPQSGAVYVVLLQPDGQAKAEQKISNTAGGLGQLLAPNDEFGAALGAPGDLDGDGVPDLAVGAVGDDGAGSGAGAVYVLRLNATGSVQSSVLLDDLGHGAGDAFGGAVAGVGDVDGDGVGDLLVGAPGSDIGGSGRGAAWLLFLEASGDVADSVLYAWSADGPFADLGDGAGLGTATARAGDVDHNGEGDLLIGDALGSGHLMLLSSLGDDATPFVPEAAVFDGKPGRSALVPLVSGDDGYQDFIDEPVVVVTNTSGNGVNLRVGASAGAGGSSEEIYVFSEGGSFATGESPLDVLPGDFFDDSAFSGVDGTLADLAVANFGSHSVSLLEALPGGTYAPHVEFDLTPDNAAPVALQGADFNGDGHSDVAVAGSSGVTVLLGDGAGGFPARTLTPLAWLTDLAVGDVNGDAHVDLVCTSGRAVSAQQPGEEGRATVLLGVGDGTFAVAGEFATGQALASVLLADLDHDLVQDVLITVHALADGPAAEPEGRIELYLGDGLGGFAASSTFAGYAVPSAQGIHPTLGTLDDLDGDGWLDAVYSSNDSIAFAPGTFADEQPPVELTVLRNDQLGGFEVSAVGTAYAGKGVAPILADIFPDDDGDPDAILIWYEDSDAGLGAGVGENATTFLTAFEADGSAGFSDSAGTQHPTTAAPTNGRVADVDTGGSGRLDIVVGGLTGNGLSLLTGDGEGGVRSSFLISDVGPYALDDLPPGDWVGGPREVEVLPGPGFHRPLLVSSSWEDRSGVNAEVYASLTVVDSASAGTTQTLLLPRAGELALDDVSGDGLADAVVTQRLGPGSFEGLAVHPGLPDGTFGDAELTPAPTGSALAGGVATADVNGDGLADVLTPATGTGAELLVFEPSDGTVTTSALGAAWSSVRSVAVGDLDGDGELDAAIGATDGSLRLARGLGDGSFVATPLNPAAAAVGGGAVALADVNGDGRLDVVSSTATVDELVDQAFVRVLIAQGGGAFQISNVDALQSSGAIGSLRPLLADMNEDGAVDLVLVHGTADTVSILLNQLSDFRTYGAGKAGSGGLVPRLDGQGFTTPGGAFSLELERGLGGAPGLLLFGFGEVEQAPFHVANALVMLPVALTGEVGTPGAGGFSLPLALPTDAGLVGAELSMQVLIQDAGAGAPAPHWLAASNGLTLTVVK